jgi:hypothetical protein
VRMTSTLLSSVKHAAQRVHDIGTQKVKSGGDRDHDAGGECEKGFACDHVRAYPDDAERLVKAAFR